MNKVIAAIVLTILSLNQLAFADFKLRQKVTIDGQPIYDRTVWVKGARDRSVMEFGGGNAEMAAMMPVIAEIRQCDLRQNVRINERSKKYLLMSFFESDDKPLPSIPATTKTEIIKGGTTAMTYDVTDTGERRQMFGFTARHLIIKTVMESSKDSCQGATYLNMLQDGWFVMLMPESAKCSIPTGGRRKGGTECRDKVTLKGVVRDPGLMLEGTQKMFDINGKLQSTMGYETLDVSTSLLDMALFELPAGFGEVNSEQSLMSFDVNTMTGLITGGSGDSRKVTAAKKAVGIDFFSGSVSKINQPELRQFVAGRVTANGQEGMLIMSQTDASSGAFANIIGVEIRSLKESGASKLGGLFGKVTGDDSMAKLGTSEAEVVVTLYDKYGKTAIASGTAKEKVDGKGDAAVRSAISKALSTVLPKLN